MLSRHLPAPASAVRPRPGRAPVLPQRGAHVGSGLPARGKVWTDAPSPGFIRGESVFRGPQRSLLQALSLVGRFEQRRLSLGNSGGGGRSRAPAPPPERISLAASAGSDPEWQLHPPPPAVATQGILCPTTLQVAVPTAPAATLAGSCPTLQRGKDSGRLAEKASPLYPSPTGAPLPPGPGPLSLPEVQLPLTRAFPASHPQ